MLASFSSRRRGDSTGRSKHDCDCVVAQSPSSSGQDVDRLSQILISWEKAVYGFCEGWRDDGRRLSGVEVVER